MFDQRPDYGFLKRLFRDLFAREGYEFDYVFDWTILKYQQAQCKVQDHVSSIPGASDSCAVSTDVDNHQGLNAYSGHDSEHVRSGNATSAGFKFHFKSPVGKKLSPENPLDKNIFGEANNPSTSHSPAGALKRTSLKPVLPTEASYPGRGQGSKVGQSSNWMSSLQRMPFAK